MKHAARGGVTSRSTVPSQPITRSQNQVAGLDKGFLIQERGNDFAKLSDRWHTGINPPID